MRSPIVKRSIVISGRKTSVSLEDAFWRGLKEIAYWRRATLSDMVTEIDRTRQQTNLSSAIRLYVLERLRRPAATSVERVARFDGEMAAAGNVETRI